MKPGDMVLGCNFGRRLNRQSPAFSPLPSRLCLEGDIHFIRVHRFPYGLIHPIDPNRISILSVMNSQSRYLDYWKSRIS